MEKMKMHSPNLTQENIARFHKLFPGCVNEAHDENGKLRLSVDFDQLRQELSDAIAEGPQERYHLNWPGKRKALLTQITLQQFQQGGIIIHDQDAVWRLSHAGKPTREHLFQSLPHPETFCNKFMRRGNSTETSRE